MAKPGADHKVLDSRPGIDHSTDSSVYLSVQPPNKTGLDSVGELSWKKALWTHSLSD